MTQHPVQPGDLMYVKGYGFLCPLLKIWVKILVKIKW